MKQPKIRFKGFSGEWEKTAFSEIVNRVSASAYSSITPGVEFEDINAGEGTLNKDVRKKKTVKIGKLFNAGDVLFGKLRPYLKNILLAGFNGVAIGDFWVLRPEKVTPELLYILVNSREFMRIANISSGSKMPRADWNLVSSSSFAFPKLKEEQIALGSYFQHLDSLIQSTAKKIDSLKQVKAASLQSMFPQEGKIMPRVRMGKRNDSWKECKLNSILIERHEVSTITQDLPQLSFTIAEGVIRPEDRKSNQRDFLIKDKDNKRYLITRIGDIIYNPANVVYGAIHRNSLMDGVVSPIYRIFSTNQDSRFIECVVRRPSFISQLAMRTEGTVTKLKTLKPEAFLDMTVSIPTDMEEQRKIGEYFKSLDTQINLQTQRLEKLKQIKSACLDKMFV